MNNTAALPDKELPSRGGFRWGGAGLNTSVDAKYAKKKYQGRKEMRKPSPSSRSWLFSFASFASTLAFNNPAKARRKPKQKLFARQRDALIHHG